ncbi:MAG TPA: winged helix DNA-binding domain-containing protein, partial [Candidatus Limnocylindrales bacterium]|nr:winged helix DNA-binding domain-containing protein [Candidatus Limnocylindrales bacterium]
QRDLNRALLARQLLLERVDEPIPTVLEQICGIQNQYAPNAYIRLWSTIRNFRRDDLTRSYEDRSVVQATMMRGTIHTASARDYRLFVAAIRPSQRDWARRITRTDDSDLEAVIARVRAKLRGRAVARAELLELKAGSSAASWLTLDAHTELLRLPPSGTWDSRRAHTFGLADDWLGPGDSPPEAEAIAHLVRRYLGGFGPASVGDVAAFTYIPMSTLKPILARMPLRRFVDERGKELLDVEDAPLPPADTPAPVRFLPTWDAVLLVHARRTGILDEAYRKIIFAAKVPPSFPTFLVYGRVVGTWKYVDGRVVLDAFEPLDRATRRELDDEAERLAAFHA